MEGVLSEGVLSEGVLSAHPHRLTNIIHTAHQQDMNESQLKTNKYVFWTLTNFTKHVFVAFTTFTTCNPRMFAKILDKVGVHTIVEGNILC